MLLSNVFYHSEKYTYFTQLVHIIFDKNALNHYSFVVYVVYVLNEK